MAKDNLKCPVYAGLRIKLGAVDMFCIWNKLPALELLTVEDFLDMQLHCKLQGNICCGTQGKGEDIDFCTWENEDFKVEIVVGSKALKPNSTHAYVWTQKNKKR